MPKTEPFDTLFAEYEAWFEKYPKIYEAELDAVRALLLPFENALEVGVGTGRFAQPLGIQKGVEPSKSMAGIAREKGIETVEGIAEKLPFEEGSFDFILMVTTICFVDDPLKSLREIYRVLEPGGAVIIGFVERDSAIGHEYEKKRRSSRFYRAARFFTTDEVTAVLKKVGFEEITGTQTLFGASLDTADRSIKEGFGKGAFVAIRAQKRR